MIREIQEQDRELFIHMVQEFYHSDAVLHDIPFDNIMNTYKELLIGSPYLKAYIIEKNREIAGYALISLTYSNEAGGLVVLIEELYVLENYQGMGLGSKMLDFIYSEYEDKAKRFRLELVKTNISAAKLYNRKGYIPLDYIQMVFDKE